MVLRSCDGPASIVARVAPVCPCAAMGRERQPSALRLHGKTARSAWAWPPVVGASPASWCGLPGCDRGKFLPEWPCVVSAPWQSALQVIRSCRPRLRRARCHARMAGLGRHIMRSVADARVYRSNASMMRPAAFPAAWPQDKANQMKTSRQIDGQRFLPSCRRRNLRPRARAGLTPRFHRYRRWRGAQQLQPAWFS